MKKMKLNNKGFMLVETLIVTVFVMSIFSIVYTNFYPIMAEYERREVFDDIDGKYGVYWIKKIIQSTDVNFDNVPASGSSIANDLATKYYHQFDCVEDIPYDITTQNLCNNLVNQLQIVRRDAAGNISDSGKPSIYITTFKLVGTDDTKVDSFKEIAVANADTPMFSNGLADYVSFLPEYRNIVSVNRAKYRIIVEFHRTKDDNDYYAYSTIEVKK